MVFGGVKEYVCWLVLQSTKKMRDSRIGQFFDFGAAVRGKVDKEAKGFCTQIFLEQREHSVRRLCTTLKALLEAKKGGGIRACAITLCGYSFPQSQAFTEVSGYMHLRLGGRSTCDSRPVTYKGFRFHGWGKRNRGGGGQIHTCTLSFPIPSLTSVAFRGRTQSIMSKVLGIYICRFGNVVFCLFPTRAIPGLSWMPRGRRFFPARDTRPRGAGRFTRRFILPSHIQYRGMTNRGSGDPNTHRSIPLE